MFCKEAFWLLFMVCYSLPSRCLGQKNRRCIKFYNRIDLIQFLRLNKYNKYEVVAWCWIRIPTFRSQLLIPLHVRWDELSSHTTHARCSTTEKLSVTKMAVKFIDSKSIIGIIECYWWVGLLLNIYRKVHGIPSLFCQMKRSMWYKKWHSSWVSTVLGGSLQIW